MGGEKKRTIGQAAIIPSIQSRSFDPVLASVLKEDIFFDGFSGFLMLLCPFLVWLILSRISTNRHIQNVKPKTNYALRCFESSLFLINLIGLNISHWKTARKQPSRYIVKRTISIFYSGSSHFNIPSQTVFILCSLVSPCQLFDSVSDPFRKASGRASGW